MKAKREFPRIVVNRKAEQSLKGGHPWVYGAEAVDREPCENGAEVSLTDTLTCAPSVSALPSIMRRTLPGSMRMSDM